MGDDATLVSQAVAGDLSAFTAICARYEERVHDLALAILRDRTAAQEVVNDTFLEASEHLESLRDPHRLPVWLLAITRFQAGLVGGDGPGPDRQPTLPDDVDDEQAALISQVWEATAHLPLRERALLDLSLRQGLDGADLADALGVSPEEAAGLEARLGDLEKGLAGYLITRQADRRCRDLPLVLRGWDGHFTPVVANGIAHHVSSCKVCENSRSELPSPLRLYASAAAAPRPGQDPVRANALEEWGS